MSLAGFRARNHPQQVMFDGPDPDVDDRGTPWDLFNSLNDRHRFTIDVAATKDNAKLRRFYTVKDDGLSKSWAGERVWCNPPYSRLRPWLEKAWDEWQGPTPPQLIVMLLPANRTEQAWWQELVEPLRDKGSALRVDFLPDRIRFLKPGRLNPGPNERPPFGCCLLTWGPSMARRPADMADMAPS